MNLPTITLDELLGELYKERVECRDDTYLTFDELRDTTDFSERKLRLLIRQANKDKRLSVKIVSRECVIPGKMVPKAGYKFLPKTSSPKKKS